MVVGFSPRKSGLRISCLRMANLGANLRMQHAPGLLVEISFILVIYRLRSSSHRLWLRLLGFIKNIGASNLLADLCQGKIKAVIEKDPARRGNWKHDWNNGSELYIIFSIIARRFGAKFARSVPGQQARGSTR